jgi:hypothetical protein
MARMSAWSNSPGSANCRRCHAGQAVCRDRKPNSPSTMNCPVLRMRIEHPPTMAGVARTGIEHAEIVGRELVEQGHAVGDAAVIDLAAILVERQVELGQQGFGIAGLRAAQQRRSTAKHHRQQDADDGDDHQHFRQGKTSAATTAPRQSHSPCMSRHRLIHHFVQFTTSSCVPNKRSGPAEINRQSSGLTGRSTMIGSVSLGPLRRDALRSRMKPSNVPSLPKSASPKYRVLASWLPGYRVNSALSRQS